MGGHLELIRRLKGCFATFPHRWVTAAESGADDLRRAGETVIDLQRFSRARPSSIPKNVVSSLSLALRHRPRIVVATGAGSVVAFCLFTRLLGARIIFVETMARITSPSASGRIISRLASQTLVQWPEMSEVYPRALVCRPALLEGIRSYPERQGRGCFVAVGTHRQQFDRLLAIADRAVEAAILPAPITAQSGNSTYAPRCFDPKAFLTGEQLEAAMNDSEFVVCHAGSGLIAAALRAGRKPLVVARKTSLGEHVDDHQDQLLERLAAADLIVPVRGEIEDRHLEAARVPPALPADLISAPPVGAVVGRWLEAVAGGRAS